MAHSTDHFLLHPFPPDLSQHLLELPQSRPRFRGWFLLAVVAGILLALSAIAVGNLIF
jgi:hypothetical protein